MSEAYCPKPIDTSNISLPPSLVPLMEFLARNTHEVWAAARLKNGWTYGPRRDDLTKKHPCLVPFEDLPEEEREYDRRTTEETLKSVLANGYTIAKQPGR